MNKLSKFKQLIEDRFKSRVQLADSLDCTKVLSLLSIVWRLHEPIYLLSPLPKSELQS
jgi:hypothetical protein